jgi:RNA polymerase sigma-70 factor (ECF subfamily)
MRQDPVRGEPEQADPAPEALVPEDLGQAAFVDFVAAVAGPVRRYLHRRTDPDTAEDVLGDVFVVCWRRRAELPADPLPWVYVVARNCLANAARAARRRDRLARRVAEVTPLPVVDPSDVDAGPGSGVLAALGRLRAPDAELLRLWAWEDLAPARIAQVLGISPNAAAIRLHRARRRLREQLVDP